MQETNGQSHLWDILWLVQMVSVVVLLFDFQLNMISAIKEPAQPLLGFIRACPTTILYYI